MDEKRKKKLDEIARKGVAPFAYSFKRTHYANDVIENYDKLEGKKVRVAGRLTQKRSFGKLVFAHLQDVSGRVQVFVRADETDKKSFELFDSFIDAGDLIGGEGVVTKTKKGEKSVSLTKVELLAKSLREMPEKFHGVKDTETRYRKRYLDLIMNDDVKKIFVTRAKIIALLRKFLDEKGFLEVETPVLQPLYGGAAAKPFKTHHNALDADFYLRIADELYLKRLVIGGFERVYEISKDFRNEDVDSTHNPEFTMLEFYQAYADYNEMMDFCEEMFGFLAKNLFGSHLLHYQGKKVDFAPPFKRVSIVEEIKKKSGVDILSFGSDAEAEAAAKKAGIEVEKPRTRARVLDAFFTKFVLPELWNPCFVTDYPEYVCPFAKKKRGGESGGKRGENSGEGVAERFELYVAGNECGNAFSEVNDPLEQRRKFAAHAEARRHGDEEAQPFDEDFLEAMEYGMPPTGGVGIGVDRLAMLFADQPSIKEVILFPSMKPLGKK